MAAGDQAEVGDSSEDEEQFLVRTKGCRVEGEVEQGRFMAVRLARAAAVPSFVSPSA